MQFSLVSTIFNEALRLEATISDLKKQSFKPNEIIITDAGSTDGSYEMLLKWKSESDIPIIIIQKSKCNVAQGRNLAINKSNYEIIVSTDFGCRFHKDWFLSITEPFIDDNVQVVGGGYTVNETEQVSTAAKAMYIITTGYNVDMESSWFVPSSRSIAYRKSVYFDVGGYCEWLTLAADDLVFGLEIIAKNYKIHTVNKKYVFWGRHTQKVGFTKEANRYGLGDGEANVNIRNFIRTFAELLSPFILLIGSLILFNYFESFGRFNLIIKSLSTMAILIALIGLRPLLYLFKSWFNFKSNKYNTTVLYYSVYLFYLTKTSYIRGYIEGFFFSSSITKYQASLLKKRLNYGKT